MFFSAEDDDDFSPSFGASGGGKSNLSSLFGADQAAFNSSKNESLHYTAPKQPKKQAASGGQETPPAVIHAVAAQAFKFVNGQYASQGKLGVAVLGNHLKKEYRLLVYASKKQQVTSAKITSTFSFVVQANNYASFYDDARQSWSLRFDTLQGVVDFAKQVGLARYNSAPGSLIKQDLQPGDGQAVESGDAIEVKYTGSLWTKNSFGKVFDSNAAADKLFKFRPGKGKVIKGWEDGVLGMKKGGKRLLAIPPELAYGDKGVPSRVPPKSTLLFEVEISRVKFSKEKPENISSETSTPAHEQSHTDDVNSSASSGHSREDEDLRERTASLSKELSVSPEKGSEKAKLLARMSKMGKNVLKIPGAVAADPDGNEHEHAETAENVGGHASARTQVEPVPERPRSQSHEYHDPSGNPHPHSPGKPPIAPRSAHVNRVAHQSPVHAPSHVTQTQPPPQYHTEYQNAPPVQTQQIPPQHQTLALYQTPLQQTPPIYQQPAQYSFPQPQPPFQPVYQQPVQPVFQPAPPVQPQPPPPSSSGGTSDVMMPMLMTESRQHQTEVRQAITKVSEKIDSLEHKIDILKQSNGENSGAIRPAVPGLSEENLMEASVLMNSIVKLVQENERMRRENVEKTAKIEDLNEKISQLLHRSQKYVEQSNIFLEQRNESLQQTTSYSQSKLVQLEREKATMSTELGSYKQNFATMETELEILRKQDAENRELLKKTSSQLQKNTTELGTTKETLAEREDELEKLTSSVKNLKQERKKLEGNLTSMEETANDLKQEKESLEKSLSDRKKKHAEIKKRMDEEIEEIKSSHEEELSSLKERHRRELTSSSSSLSQQISQLETEMESKWQDKSKQMVHQCEKKWQRKYDDVVEEFETLKKKISESEEKHSTMKTSQTQHLQEIEDLQEKLKDLEEIRSKYTSMKNSQSGKQQEIEELRERVKDMENTQKKYQDLRMKSIEMKEKYEQRLQQMTEEKEIAVKEAQEKTSQEKQEDAKQQAAEPSRNKIINEVKQIMNKVFFKIREEFVAGDSYQGSAIISIVLNVIKTMTMKMTSGEQEEEEEESEDESEEEESEEEEGEISEEGEDEVDDDDEKSGKEENEKNENGKVEVEKSEEEKSEEEEEDDDDNDDEKSGSEEIRKNQSGKVKDEESEEEENGENESADNGKLEDEKIGDDESGEKEEGNAEIPGGKVEKDESGQAEWGSSIGEEIQDEGKDDKINNEGEIEKDVVKETQAAVEEDENKLTEREEISEDENDKNKEIRESTPMDTDGKEEIIKDSESPPKIPEDTVESPLHLHAKYRDSEDDEEDMGSQEINKVPSVTIEGESEDIGEQLKMTRDKSTSEEDLENISNRPVHGSEDASISSEEENIMDNSEQDEGERGPLESDLPTMDELSIATGNIDGSEESGNKGESTASKEFDSEVENTEKKEKDEELENGGGETIKTEAENATATEEKAKEEKNNQSLSDFLSDDEDDVDGLFDSPAPKTISTPAKKEEGPSLKPIPPPLFDDDDDDDLDWFS